MPSVCQDGIREDYTIYQQKGVTRVPRVSIVTEFLNIWDDLRKYYSIRSGNIRSNRGRLHGRTKQNKKERDIRMLSREKSSKDTESSFIAADDVITGVKDSLKSEILSNRSAVNSSNIEVCITNKSEYSEISESDVLAGVSFPFSDFLTHIVEQDGETRKSVETFNFYSSISPVNKTCHLKSRKKNRKLPQTLRSIAEEDRAIISVAISTEVSINSSKETSNPSSVEAIVTSDCVEFEVEAKTKCNAIDQPDVGVVGSNGIQDTNFETTRDDVSSSCEITFEEDIKVKKVIGDKSCADDVGQTLYSWNEIIEKSNTEEIPRYPADKVANGTFSSMDGCLDDLKIDVDALAREVIESQSQTDVIRSESFYEKDKFADNNVSFLLDIRSEVLDENNNSAKFTPSLPIIIDAEDDAITDEEYFEGVTVDKNVEDPGSVSYIVDVKHPLEHEWTFWYFYPDKSRAWEENLKQVKTVSTIEDFWAVQNWIEPASRLNDGADYSLFKTGITPDWEDLANRKGGRWVVRTQREEVDSVWMEVIMGIVGHTFEERLDTQINGGVVSIRSRGDKVAVWVKTVEVRDRVRQAVTKMLGKTGMFKVHRKEMGK